MYSSKIENISTGLMLMVVLSETIDQLAMANSVRWYGNVLRREGCHVLRLELDLEMEDQWKKGSLWKTWNKLIEELSVMLDL